MMITLAIFSPRTQYNRVVPLPAGAHASHLHLPRDRVISFVTQVILPDYLPGNPYSDLVQPVWCSYALGARTVTIISAKGTIFYQRTWLQTDLVEDALDQYWLGWSGDS